MIFEVDDQVFVEAVTNDGRSQRLASLVTLAGREPHAIHARSGESGPALQWLNGCGRHAASYRETLREGTRQASRASAERSRVTVVAGRTDLSATPRAASVEDAETLARTPLSVWLEDSESDRGFLDRAVGQRLRDRLRRLEREPLRAVRFEHGGGGVIQRLMAELQPLHAVRSWAMIDSDREKPGAAEPEKVAKTRSTCAAQSIELHVLARREAENYLPPAVLEWWARTETEYNNQFSTANRSALVRALLERTREERAFIDMKSALGRRCGEMFRDNAPEWRPRWFDDDGSQAEFEAIKRSLEERL